VRYISIEEIAALRLEYIKKLQAERAELKETIERMKKSKSGYWNQGSLLKAESKREDEKDDSN
tara:strand:- start:240 stop:428 length:189 start_codon:yes stop_codon:yes gene_type:complete